MNTMTTTERPARTRRSPDGAYAGVGAVRQSGGSLPIYVCNTCAAEVVWVTGKTGRKYLANVYHGYRDQRYYVAASLHRCEPRLAARDERERQDEADNHARYQLWLVDQHEASGHPEPVALCIRCNAAALHPREGAVTMRDYQAEERSNRDEIARLVEGLAPELRDGWYAIKESYEYFDGETEIELGYLRKYIKEATK